MVGFGALVALGRARAPRASDVSRSDVVGLLVAGTVGMLLNLFMFIAFSRTTIALALICFYVYPAIVTLAAVRFYGEPLDRARLGALLLASAGLVLVVLAPALGSAGLRVDGIGVVLALSAAGLQAVYMLVVGKGFRGLPSMLASGLIVCLAGASYLVLSALTGDLPGFLRPFGDASLWPFVVLGAIVGSALPGVAHLAGVRRIGPTSTSILMMFEPVVGVTLAAIALGERPSPLQLVGGTAVLAAGLILQRQPPVGVAVEETPSPTV